MANEVDDEPTPAGTSQQVRNKKPNQEEHSKDETSVCCDTPLPTSQDSAVDMQDERRNDNTNCETESNRNKRKGTHNNQAHFQLEDNEDLLHTLEIEYETALEAFKKDKNNKDLRRAKTSAKKAWDAALVQIAESASAETLICRNCSHLFLFTNHRNFEQRGWDVDTCKPKQCPPCSEKAQERTEQLRTKRDQKHNMCYEFQKYGNCSRGEKCKFSHDPHYQRQSHKNKQQQPQPSASTVENTAG